MAKGEILGHIDCPACGFVGGMRITEDKSGNPFGYCEGDCDQQMRIGGSLTRVKKFYAKYPHIKQPGAVVEILNAAPGTAEKTAPAEVKNPVSVTETKTGPKHWSEMLGVK